MQVPASILQFGCNIVLNHIGAIADEPLSKIPHVNVVAQAYRDGQSLEVIVGLYLQATGQLKPEEIAGEVGKVLEFIDTQVPRIVADISKKPLKDVLVELLGNVAIPSVEGEVGTKKVIDIINSIMAGL